MTTTKHKFTLCHALLLLTFQHIQVIFLLFVLALITFLSLAFFNRAKPTLFQPDFPFRYFCANRQLFIPYGSLWWWPCPSRDKLSVPSSLFYSLPWKLSACRWPLETFPVDNRPILTTDHSLNDKIHILLPFLLNYY